MGDNDEFLKGIQLEQRRYGDQVLAEYEALNERPRYVAPYVPPTEDKEFGPGGGLTKFIRPLALIVVAAGGVYVAGVAAYAIGAAILALVSQYALYIGGGALALLSIVLAVFGCRASAEEAHPPSSSSHTTGGAGRQTTIIVNVGGESATFHRH